MTSPFNQLANACWVLLLMLMFATEVMSQSNTPNKYRGGDISFRPNVTLDSLIITNRVLINCGSGVGGTVPINSRCGLAGTVQFSQPTTTNLGQINVSDVCTSDSSICNGGPYPGTIMVTYESIEAISVLEGALPCGQVEFIKQLAERFDAENTNNTGGGNDRMRLTAVYELGTDTFNSSPVFNGDFLPLVCSGSDVAYDPNVTDVDGDSLVFSIREPDTGNIVTAGFRSYTGGSAIPGITIDTETGILEFTSPATEGAYQIVIQVDEYDRATGQQISMVFRDFQIEVEDNCTNDGPVPAAAFSSLVNEASTVGNDTITLDTNVAASFRLLFTDGNGIAGYTSNAVSVLGGNATFNTTNSQISWTPGVADIGTHIITLAATDNACEISGKGAHKIVVIVQAAAQPFVISIPPTGAQTCPSPPNGSLTVNFTGGTGPFLFAVQGNFTGTTDTNSTGIFNSLVFDVYRVFAIDSSTLSDTTTAFAFTVLQNMLEVTGFTSLADVSCDDACDGSLRVNRAGGVTPYSYLWTNGQTTRTATDLCGGSPVVTVTDNQGCAIVDTAFLFEPPALFAAVDSTDSASCFGEADGAAFLSAHGGVAASTSTSDYVVDSTQGSFEPYPYGEAQNVSSYSAVALTDESLSAAINIGFNFDFYGNTKTQFRLHGNGFLTFQNAVPGTNFVQSAIPSTNAQEDWIGVWEDLNPGAGGVVETYRAGSSPNRVRVINYIDVPQFTTSELFTFQIVLYETSNIIQIYLDSVPTVSTAAFDGGIKVVGIENLAGDTAHFVATQNGTNFNAEEEFVTFIPIEQNFTYAWSSIGSGASATNLTAGTYTVTVDDPDDCADTLTFEIFSPSQIDIDSTITQPSCVGDNDGEIAVTATGGNGGPYTFTWNTGFVGTPITGLVAGTYTVVAEDATGCEDSITVVVTDPDPITVTFNPVTNVLCNGDSTGSATAIGAGGTSGTFTYAWTGPLGALTGATINNLPAGKYFVTATDGNGCTGNDSIDITEPGTAITITSVDSTDETCAGAADGTATAAASGGTGTITFAWSPSGTGANITGLTADTYIVTATDANGCEAVDSTVVNAPASSIVVNIIDSTMVLCNGDTTGDAEAGNASGGLAPYTYAWSEGTTGQIVANLGAGTYTVTAEDANGCEGTDSVVITEPATAVDVSITLDSNASCNGFSDGGLTAVGSGGTGAITYSWNTTATTPTITGLAANTYTVIVEDANGCQDSATQVVGEPSAVVASINTTQPACSSGTGSATASGTGGSGAGYTFLWSPNAGGVTTATVTGLTADTYTVTVTDGNDCIDTEETTIVTGGGFTLTMTQDSVSCLGGDDGEATATPSAGAVGAVTYSWTGTTQTSQTVTGLTADQYFVTATDGNGCTANDSIDVLEPATGVTVAVGGDDINCFGDDDGVAHATPAGGTPGYTFSWDNGGSTDTITGLAPNTYRVTVTDANGCTANDSITLTQPAIALLAFISSTNPSCNGANDGLLIGNGFPLASGPFSFEWNTGILNDSLENIPAGTYTVTVTDANGCTDDQDATLIAPSAITLTTDTNSESCLGANDGLATVSPTGGQIPYSFLWDFGGSTNDTIFNVPSGTYNVTVTDANGCTEETSVTIDAGTGVVLTMDSLNPLCNGDNSGQAMAIATGNGNLTYAWSNTGTTDTIFNLVADTYVVTVTDTAGCQAIDSVQLEDPTLLTVTAAPTNPTCNGGTGSITANDNGGTGTITYAWSTSASSQTITGLTADTYTVTVTDANLCTAADTVDITEPVAVVTTASALLFETCAGDDGQATVTFSNTVGAPTFGWSNGQTSQTITGLSADTYSVTVTDANGCTDSSEVDIIDTCGCAFDTATLAIVDQIDCPGNNNGSAWADPVNGTGPFTFLWNTGSTNDTIFNLTAGTYTVTITDNGVGAGCTHEDSITLTDPAGVSFNAFSNITEVSCDDACDGAVTANATSPNGGLLYSWSTGANTQSLSALCGGGYTVTATDVNGCQDSAIFALVEPPSIWVTLDSTDSAVCTAANGDAFLTARGGFASSTSTATYVIDTDSGEYEPYAFGEPLNANSYELVTLQDDAMSDTIEIFNGGDFDFFGNTETHFVICSQGFITFDASNINSGQVNGMFSVPAAIPNTAANSPEEFIAGYWTDLDPSVGVAQIETYEIGTVPNRARIVNFIDIEHFNNGTIGSGDTSTFQIVLYENSNIIQIHSPQLRSDGGNMVQGIENQAGTIANSLTTRNAQDFEADNDYIAFIPVTQNYTFNWSSIGTGSSATNLTPGVYTVTAEDPNGCSDSVSFEIFSADSTILAGLTVDQGVSCTAPTDVGKLFVNPSGGVAAYTQLWSNAATTDTISNLAAGTYTVTVSDANGCQDSAQVTLSGISPSIPTPTILTPDTSVCPGTTLTLQGQNNSNNTYTDTSAYLCTNTSGGLVTAVFSNVPATASGDGTLTLEAAGDLGGFLGFLEFLTIVDETSNNVGTFQGAAVDCDTSDQTYTLTQANINSWAANNVVSFVVDASIFVTANTCNNTAFCAQATLSFPTVSDSAYWFDDPLTLDTALAIGGGDSVVVTPTTNTSFYYAAYNGVCFSEPDTINITMLPSVTASITQNTQVACPGDSASVTASGVGGTGTYSFLWDSGDTTATVNLPAGTWCVTVTDDGGTCEDTACVIISPADTLMVAATGIEPLCNGDNNGSATATTTNGINPITFAWSNGQNGSPITGLTADTYIVVATDNGGCTATDTLELDEPTPLVLDFTGSSNVSCNGLTDGEACANISGGTPTYSFSWSTGGVTQCIDPLPAGDYTVTITDANNCTISDTAFIIEPPLLVVQIDSTDTIDCFGDNTGVAYSSVTGGTPNYTFAWPNGSTADTAMGLTAGTYEVTVTDASLCEANATATIIQPATGMTVSVTNTDSVSCFGGNDGEATALAVNAQGTPTYAWSSGDLTATTTSGLTADIYTVTATDASGCTASAFDTIFQPAEITITFNPITNPSCFGGDDGAVTATANNAIGTVSYAWDSGQNGAGISGLTAGDYIVTATDANGCTGTDTVTLTDPAGMTATFQNVLPSSCTACTGEAEVDVSGGALPLSYVWPNAQTLPAATALCSGINRVTVTDNNLCVDSFAIAIPSDSADTVIALGTNPLCAGVDNGTVFTSNTCTGGCTFTWTDSATAIVVGTTDTVTGLPAATYIVEMENASGCSSFDTIRLTNPLGITVTITNQDDVSCLGGNDGGATVAATGGSGTISFSWSTSATGPTISGLTAGTYTAYATDTNGCVDSVQVFIAEPATGLTVVATTDDNVTCNGGNDGEASAVPAGGTGTVTLTWNGTLTGSPITGLTAGQYIVVASDASGCTATDTADVIEPTPVVAILDSITDPTCPLGTDGQITVTGSGGEGTYTYAWLSGNTSNQETGLAAGIYCVTITDGDGCEVEYCDTLTDPTGMTNTFTGIQNATCGVCDGEAIAVTTGGNGSNYTYSWNNGVTIDTNTTLCVGVNTVTITDSLGCELVDAMPTSEDGADTVLADSIPGTCGNCDGEAFAIYNCNNGPCTVEWTAFGSATVIGTTDTISDLCAGTYFVQLTNNLGCSSLDEVEVTVPDTILPNETIVDVSCGGGATGSITLAPTGGSGTYSYTWSNGAGNTATNSNLTAGNYTVTIADNAACDTIITFTVNPGSDIILNETIVDASCFGEDDGSIALAPTGGAGSFTYEWNPIPSNGQGVQSALGLTAGEYRVTVTDAALCAVSDTFDVGQGDEILQTAVTIDSAECGVCDGAIAPTFAGGAGGFTFDWSTGATTNNVSALCFGFYDVTVTDANLCTEVFGYPVSEVDGPEILLTGLNTSAQGVCDGEAYVAVVNSTGTVTFEWSTGSTNDTITGLCAGQYIITATDANGCSTVDTININEPNILELSFDVTDITCAGGPCDGEIVALPTGGVAPYTFAWSNSSSNDTISSLCVGTYVLTLTDDNGTSIIDSVTLANPSPFVITPTVVATSCPGECDGSISLNITGPGLPSILWETGDATATIDSLCAGFYKVTVSDTSGCDDSLTIEVIAPDPLTATLASVTQPDCQIPNGSITVTPGGGSGSAYTFEWLDFQMNPLVPAQTTATASNLFAGIYNLVLTDVNGCQDTFDFILNNLNAPVITLDSIINASCFGECDGEIQVTVTGGTAPIVYQWSSGGTAEDDTALCAGPDTIAVADANLCLAFDFYEITEPEELMITSLTSTDVLCGSNCDGTVAIASEGGTLPHIYSWSNGSTDTAQTELCAGTYTVTVTDTNGCSVVDSVVVSGPQPMVIAIDSIDSATCDYTSDGQIAISVSGGAAPYSYNWMDADSAVYSSDDLANIIAGEYILTVTDTLGCTVSDTITIGVKHIVIADAGVNKEVCPDSRQVFVAGVDSFATSTRWIDDLGTILSDGSTALIDAKSDTTVLIFEALNERCVARDTMFVIETRGPEMEAGFAQFIEPADEVMIGGNPTARSGVTDISWTPSIDLSSSTDENPMAFPLQTTWFYVSGVDEDGCFGIDSVLVTVEKIIDPVGGFSPNDDGVNEFFVIDRIEKFPDAQVNIFNRWGNLIFESDPGYTTPWDGTYNGKTLTVGTYYYVIDLKDAAVDELITGPVSILK